MKHYQYISKSDFLPLVTKFYLNKKNPEKVLTYNSGNFQKLLIPDLLSFDYYIDRKRMRMD